MVVQRMTRLLSGITKRIIKMKIKKWKWLTNNRKYVDITIIMYLALFTGQLTIATILLLLYIVDPRWKCKVC
jgi:hypothetical protein